MNTFVRLCEIVHLSGEFRRYRNASGSISRYFGNQAKISGIQGDSVQCGVHMVCNPYAKRNHIFGPTVQARIYFSLREKNGLASRFAAQNRPILRSSASNTCYHESSDMLVAKVPQNVAQPHPRRPSNARSALKCDFSLS